MLYENIKDAAIIVQNIINQPLAIADASQDITLLSAALSFGSDAMPASYLESIMKKFVEYQDPTETLIRELDILANELKL
jgi:hypothetical protein